MKKLVNQNLTNLIILIMICSFGLITTLYVGITQYTEKGIEYLWLLPMTFTICSFFLYNIVKYHKGGCGIKILYATIIVRYCIHPILVAKDGSTFFVSRYQPTNITYIVAIIMMCLELIVVCLTLYFYYESTAEKVKKFYMNSETEIDNQMHLSSVIVIFLLIMLMIVRGNANEILPAMRFLLATEKLDNVPFDSYSIIALQAIKSFVTVSIIAWASKKSKISSRKVYFGVALIAAMINCSIYFGNNRSSVLQTDIATILVLIAAFRKEKKYIYLTIIPLVIVVMGSFILIKQYGLDVTKTTDVSSADSDISKTIDAYVCGVKTMAVAYDRYAVNGIEFGLLNFMRDITDNIFLFKIPGFMFVNNIFSAYPTSVELFSGESTAMMPVFGQTLYYGGHIFGWALDLIAFHIVVRLLIKFDLKQQYERQYLMKFIYAWLSSLFGLIMCYCLITLLWSFSNTPFFLLVLIYVNKRIVIKQKK